MTWKHRTAILTLTALVRLPWRAAEASRRLGEAGERLENWVDRTAAYRGIDIVDVLAPLTERHSAPQKRPKNHEHSPAL
jgi:hypothetical protein